MVPKKPQISVPAEHKVASFPAPIGGLNVRDSLAAMPQTDSPALVNWIPDIGGLRSRKGTVKWVTVASGVKPVKSVIGYFGPTGSPGAFVAASDASIPSGVGQYNWAVTDSGLFTAQTRGAAPVLSKALSGGTDAGIVNSTAMTTSGSSFLAICSETDGYFYHDAVAGTFTTPALTGVSASSLCFVTQWKRRLWFVEKNSTRAWYLAVDSVTGTATKFDFGPVFRNGGKLAYIASWTIDAGEGIDDLLVAVSEQGDVVVYKGTDPSSSSTFALVGRWFIGPVPVGRRGFCQYGGDLLLLSVNGIFPMSFVTRGGTDVLLASAKEFSTKISPALSTDIRQTFTTMGWTMSIHPQERLLMITVPDYTGSSNKQYVLNIAQNSWTIFNDIPLLCCAYTGQFMFGGTPDGRVLLLNTGSTDELEVGVSLGNTIQGQVAFPFSYFGTPAQEKHFLLGRPVFLSALQPGVTFDVSTNFEYENQPQPTSPSTQNPTALFDLGLFDAAVWDGITVTPSAWFGWENVDGIGFAGAITLRTVTEAYTTLVSADIMYEEGGYL